MVDDASRAFSCQISITFQMLIVVFISEQNFNTTFLLTLVLIQCTVIERVLALVRRLARGEALVFCGCILGHSSPVANRHSVSLLL